MPQPDPHRVVLVTGVTSGIGLALARRLWNSEFRVVATGRKESLRKIAREEFHENERFLIRPLDVTIEAERQAMIDRLAGQLMEKFGAPGAGAARLAAEEEIAFAASLCEHAPQTLLAVQRSVENGEIRERFRTLKPRQTAADADRLHAHVSAFTFHEVEGDVEPVEEVDLRGLIKADRMTTDRT